MLILRAKPIMYTQLRATGVMHPRPHPLTVPYSVEQSDFQVLGNKYVYVIHMCTYAWPYSLGNVEKESWDLNWSEEKKANSHEFLQPFPKSCPVQNIKGRAACALRSVFATRSLCFRFCPWNCTTAQMTGVLLRPDQARRLLFRSLWLWVAKRQLQDSMDIKEAPWLMQGPTPAASS